jgi:hypothetical protein
VRAAVRNNQELLRRYRPRCSQLGSNELFVRVEHPVVVARERPDALFAAPDIFFAGRAAQSATFTAREMIPAAYAVRELVVAGGLMSYGTDLADLHHQVGFYSGSILKGAKTTDLPVLQLSKFEFVIRRPARLVLKCRPEFCPSLTRLSTRDAVCRSARVRTWGAKQT